MYKVILTSDAIDDINQVIVFIPSESGFRTPAIKYLDKLEHAILSLSKFPERGSIPRYKILKNQSYKFIVIENHLIFYKINEDKKLVVIYRVLHQKSSYQHFL